ncbi:GMP synthase [Candidatus Bathyarchaeota archaeon]|nr:MAG: GMP synthase [Candidatus Bathyarchaeota archaeon]
MSFDPERFVEERVEEIRQTIGNAKALVAISGGVDSTTSAVLTHKAIGDNLVCVFLDDAFMREGEPEKIADLLSQPPINLPVKIMDVRERFLNALKGIRDAEEKRKAFREAFYQTLAEIANREGCSFLVQGTIKADIVETVGGVKTQHNVLAQIGIKPTDRYGFQVVEPLVSLYKWQVRMVARYLGLPPEISERQPFPGPGLAVRIVGEIKEEKLNSLKKATNIVEDLFGKYKPSQYFAAIIDNRERLERGKQLHVRELAARALNVPSSNVGVKIFEDRATGVKSGRRLYGEIVAVKVFSQDGKMHAAPLNALLSLQAKIITEMPSFTRVLYCIAEAEHPKEYVIAMRAINTRDFLTASVAEIPWETLQEAAQKILETCKNVSEVYYDVTPKPPATIEME